MLRWRRFVLGSSAFNGTGSLALLSLRGSATGGSFRAKGRPAFSFVSLLRDGRRVRAVLAPAKKGVVEESLSRFSELGQRSDRLNRPSETADNSSRINTYTNHATNPFRMRTYKIADYKSPRMNTYEKAGGGGTQLLLRSGKRPALTSGPFWATPPDPANLSA